ncbi:hypothetical protein AMIS_24290 [Actinoplanes missouriensis 431]|uniref:Uncharacterized protein n=1 Tax=Actinoplanes missouriensis (strain ATCC 14538 / DSM 43046 / CBS 188.64 / JCM 3121 / NBRC 102363 / NCIMB 12654 / NRRL B-3342 / UNCC 431) TaxID=512565 RepID=I0H3R2_ACTM4|nr:hypothetical protein [Actinoplanes missouriensis]BAL87649.1 hypothetical protein AMIS_24290 [Actinoplanes missouriensis 431]
MEIWDPLAGALVTQLINVMVAALCGVRFRRSDAADLADPTDPPDERWVEVRMSWCRGRSGEQPGPGECPGHDESGPDERPW